MDKIVEKVIPLLDADNIKYYLIAGKIRVPLPNNFGELEISDLDDDDTIIGLIDNAFHTHGDVLRGEYETGTDEEAIYTFLKNIFDGEFYLIQESEKGKVVRRVFENDLDSYYKYLPEGTEAKIVFGK